MYGTPTLFYGPSAHEEATTLASSTGFLLESIGKDGLKVQDSRDLVALSLEGVAGESVPSVVVGPIDKATVEAADALLKTLEETEGTRLLNIILWAEDLHGVRPTIQSRCNCVWSTRLHDGDLLPPPGLEPSRFLDLYASGPGSHPEAMALLLKQDDWQGFLASVLDAAAIELRSTSVPSRRQLLESLWLSCRPIVGREGPGVVLPVAKIFCGFRT
jgi:hypothetical protein